MGPNLMARRGKSGPISGSISNSRYIEKQTFSGPGLWGHDGATDPAGPTTWCSGTTPTWWPNEWQPRAGPRYFDRRNGLPPRARPPGSRRSTSPTTGEVRTFTIVTFAAPGIPGAVRGRRGRLRGHQRAGEPDQRDPRPPSTVGPRHEGAPGHRSHRHGRQRHRKRSASASKPLGG